MLEAHRGGRFSAPSRSFASTSYERQHTGHSNEPTVGEAESLNPGYGAGCSFCGLQEDLPQASLPASGSLLTLFSVLYVHLCPFLIWKSY